MGKSFLLSIVAPDRVLFNGDVRYVSVSGGDGYLGILADHAPLIATLSPGRFEFSPVSQRDPVVFNTKNPGLFEVNNNKASILLDTADSMAF
jgi:F-type H+-transporting ATPase subunit epsilon